MIAYLLEGVGPGEADTDRRMRRLMQAGPWQYQPHAGGGTLATWKAEGPRPMSSFGKPRKTTDGMMYFPPLEIPRPEDLVRQDMSNRSDLHWIDVETGEGTARIAILPAYGSPRRILEDNMLGDYTAIYARSTRMLLGRMSENPDINFNDIASDLFSVCRQAIRHTTRCTDELISDAGWLTEESMWAIWRAVLHVPKE